MDLLITTLLYIAFLLALVGFYASVLRIVLPKKDTLRLIITLKCNLKCNYCCNRDPKINSRFVKKKLDEINFAKYKNICITGGEPFVEKDLLYNVLEAIPKDKNIYIYTNGLLMSELDAVVLYKANVKGLNIGLHYFDQINNIYQVNGFLNVRYMVQDTKFNEYLRLYPGVLNKRNTKTWKLDRCAMPNEDWVVLKN